METVGLVSWDIYKSKCVSVGISQIRWRQFWLQHSQLFQEFVGAFGFNPVDEAQSEADMDHHIVTLAGFGDEVQANLPHNPAKLHASGAHRTLHLNFKDFSRYREAHGRYPRQPVDHCFVTGGCDERHTSK